MRNFLFLLTSLPLVGCVSWQPIASSAALACDAGDIRVSQAISGTLTDRWQASCRGFTYLCTMPSGVDGEPALCELQPVMSATRIVPLSE